MATERQQQILDLIKREADLPIVRIAERLGIAPDTCRRDVQSLKEEGLIDGPSFIIKPHAWLLVRTLPSATATNIGQARSVLRSRSAVGPAQMISGNDELALVTVQIPTDTAVFQDLIDALLEIDGIRPVTLHLVGVAP